MLLALMIAVQAVAQPTPAAPPAASPPATVQQAPARPPAPTAMATALPASVSDYFRGRWRGTGAFANGRPLASTFEFEPLHGGEALIVRHSEEAPHQFAYHGLWSVDTAAGGMIMVFAANRNGGARLFRSSGWEGDRMVFTPDTGLRSWFALERMTFTRLSATQFRVRYEMSRDGVRWGGGDEQVFTKS